MFVEAQPQLCGHDVACALALRRAQLKQRAVVLAQQPAELVAGLRALDRGEQHPAVLRGVARSGPVAFLFSGQGSQWPGMGRELYEHFSVFGAALDEVCGELDGFIGRSVRDVMFAAEGSPEAQLLGDTQYTQVALFALQVALYRLVESFGIRADYLVGHSIGEYAAAHVAGVFSLRDGCRLVSERARLMGALPAGGAMLAVQADGQEAEASLEGCEDRVALAAVNAPRAVVLSGDAAAIEQLETLWRERGRKTTRLRVSHAFHSQAMDAMLDDLTAVARQIACSPPRIPIVSNLTGEPLTAQQACSPEYWAQHVRQTVRFADGITWLQRAGVTRMLELGPDATLSALTAQTVDDDDVLAVSTLRGAKHPQAETFMTFLAAAHCHGVPIEWRSTFDANAVGRVELPTYAFEREHYWLAGGAGAGDVSAAGLGVVEHPLIGASMHLAGSDEWRFTGSWSLAAHPWLADHAVFDTVIAPGTAFAELALRAGAQLGCDAIDELTLHAPLLLPEHGAVHLQIAVSAPDDQGRREIEIYSRPATAAEDLDDWTSHANGTLTAAPPAARDPLADEAWPPAGAEALPIGDLYDRLAASGYAYGPAFQGVTAAWQRDDEVFVALALDEHEAEQTGRYGIHPALLDAAFHTTLGLLDDELEPGKAPLPFSWSGVRLLRGGAPSLRVAVRRSGDSLSLAASDETGRPVLTIDTLATRTIDRAALGGARTTADGGLHGVEWVPFAATEITGSISVAVLEEPGGRPAVAGAGHAVVGYRDLATLEDNVRRGASPPEVVVLRAPHADGPLVEAVGEIAQRMLELLQFWIASAALEDARLVVLTERALAADDGESPNLRHAALVGLLRSAESEHPGRIGLVDLDGEPVDVSVLAGDEPVVAVRDGAARVARVGGPGRGALVPPARAWCLGIERVGTLEELELVDAATGPLGAGEVRVAVSAAGLNFRDVVVALGLVDHAGTARLGGEGAGLVVEVGADVTGFEVGDRVMGLMEGAFGPVAVADARQLVRMPGGWSFEQAASVPVVFLTAYYGLFDQAGLSAGERVLVHGAAGGVGMAAVQLAKHAGTEVFATAHPRKWPTVVELGLDPSRIASSRSLEFEAAFLQSTGGRGVDVVLDSLAGDFVDASLRLLPRGGRFVEIGKTDIRDPEAVARTHPGVRYAAFDLLDAPAARIGQMLEEIVGLFERGVLEHLPLSCWDVRRAQDAFRHMREAKHVGKIVLRMPRRPDPDGTVLITGATSGLGALVASHLAGQGARRLVLVSRSGPRAEGAAELLADLAQRGCEAQVVACDVTDRGALAAVIDGIPSEHPLTAVVHAAGVLDDGVVATLDEHRLRRVLAPKVDGALHLHELSRDLGLSQFVMFSSIAGTLGTPGQANYAAANAFLDALAQHRRAEGLPATSLAWGAWQRGMLDSLSDDDRERGRRAGIAALTDEDGLELFDRARGALQPTLIPARLDVAALRVNAYAGTLPAILRGLVRAPLRRAGQRRGSLSDQLAGTTEADRPAAVLELVMTHVAAVLGHSGHAAMDAERPFKDLGFDSLSAVELKNRLTRASGLKLPTTLVFDHPSPAAVAELLCSKVDGAGPAPDPIDAELDKIDRMLGVVASDDTERERVARRLRSLLAKLADDTPASGNGVTDEMIHAATASDILALIDEELS